MKKSMLYSIFLTTFLYMVAGHAQSAFSEVSVQTLLENQEFKKIEAIPCDGSCSYGHLTEIRYTTKYAYMQLMPGLIKIIDLDSGKLKLSFSMTDFGFKNNLFTSTSYWDPRKKVIYFSLSNFLDTGDYLEVDPNTAKVELKKFSKDSRYYLLVNNVDWLNRGGVDFFIEPISDGFEVYSPNTHKSLKINALKEEKAYFARSTREAEYSDKKDLNLGKPLVVEIGRYFSSSSELYLIDPLTMNLLDSMRTVESFRKFGSGKEVCTFDQYFSIDENRTLIYQKSCSNNNNIAELVVKYFDLSSKTFKYKLSGFNRKPCVKHV